MPVGMFLVTHHEIRGPSIRDSYFTKEIELTPEFISQLYMSHAGFGKDFILEMKFNQYKITSVFTGDKDRKTGSEGILGIVLEDHEPSENLELFLRRNLLNLMEDMKKNSVKQIFIQKLANYINLLNILKKIRVEDMPEMFLVLGDERFKTCVLKFCYRNVNNSELSLLYEKMNKKKKITNYQYYLLNLELENRIYLLANVLKSEKIIRKILNFLIPYLEIYFNYSVEIIAMFFIPHLLNIKKIDDFGKFTVPEKQKSVLSYLKDSNDYGFEFNSIILNITNEVLYIGPSK